MVSAFVYYSIIQLVAVMPIIDGGNQIALWGTHPQVAFTTSQ